MQRPKHHGHRPALMQAWLLLFCVALLAGSGSASGAPIPEAGSPSVVVSVSDAMSGPKSDSMPALSGCMPCIGCYVAPPPSGYVVGEEGGELRKPRRAGSSGSLLGLFGLLLTRTRGKSKTTEVCNACLFASRFADGWIDLRTISNSGAEFRLINQQESVMNAVRHLMLSALGGLALSSALAQGAPSVGNIKDPWGYAVPDSQAERTVQIGPNTRWVRVTRMETIRFVVNQAGGSKTFTWRFDALPHRSFSLTDVAPDRVLGQQQVMVYVARHPQLDGGGGGSR